MIPTSVTTELAALQAQVAAAQPLTAASQATVLAIKLNGAQLASDIATALTGAAGALDSWIAPVDPAAIAAGVVALTVSATDQAALATMAGFVGRSNKNLDQLS